MRGFAEHQVCHQRRPSIWLLPPRAGTDLFLTNDKRLVGKIVPGIQFIASLDTLVKGGSWCVTVWYFKARGGAFLGANKALEWPGIAAGML